MSKEKQIYSSCGPGVAMMKHCDTHSLVIKKISLFLSLSLRHPHTNTHNTHHTHTHTHNQKSYKNFLKFKGNTFKHQCSKHDTKHPSTHNFLQKTPLLTFKHTHTQTNICSICTFQ